MVDKEFLQERLDNMFNQLYLIDEKVGVILTPADVEKLVNDEAIMIEWEGRNYQICLCEW